MKRIILSLILLGTGLIFSFAAEAKATARRSCATPDCSRIEIRISIDPGADVGKPGSFGVLATSLENDPRNGIGKVAYWTSSSGWLGFRHGDLIRPADSLYLRIPSSKEYVIYTGRKDALCKLSNGWSFNVFAWHVGLSQSQYQHMMTFMDRYEITGWQADNFMSSVLFYEANKQRKVDLVYTVNCPSRN